MLVAKRILSIILMIPLVLTGITIPVSAQAEGYIGYSFETITNFTSTLSSEHPPLSTRNFGVNFNDAKHTIDMAEAPFDKGGNALKIHTGYLPNASNNEVRFYSYLGNNGEYNGTTKLKYIYAIRANVLFTTTNLKRYVCAAQVQQSGDSPSLDFSSYSAVIFENNGKIVFNGIEHGDYEANKWYSVIQVINLKNKIATAYVNGQHLDTVSYSTSYEYARVNALMFAQAKNKTVSGYSADMYVDDIYITRSDEGTFDLTLTSSVPSDETTFAGLTPDITLHFNNEIDPSTINSIKIYDQASNLVPSSSYIAPAEYGYPAAPAKDLKTIIIKPSAFLNTDSYYRVDFSSVKDIYGSPVMSQDNLLFLTTNEKAVQSYLKTDFNDYVGSQIESITPEGWGSITSTNPNIDYAVGTLVSPKTDKSLKIHSGSSKEMFIYKYYSGLQGHILFEADLRFKDTNLTRSMYFGRKGVVFDNDASIKVNGRSISMNYLTDTWYNVKSIYNLYEKTLDVYINNTLVASDEYLGEAWPPDQSIKITQTGKNGTAGEMYIDNVEFVRLLEPLVSGMHIVPDCAVSQDKINLLKQRYPDNLHPRIMATDSSFSTINNYIAADTNVKNWYNSVKAKADGLLNSAPASGPSSFFGEIITLSAVYKLTGNTDYADQVWKNLNTLINMPDFGDHYLNLAYYTKSLAIGYDWLYNYWSREQKAMLRESIKNKGLLQGLNSYRNPPKANNGWVLGKNNWNATCNAGMLMGALAIADEEEELCAEIIESSLLSIRNSISVLSPDGGWSEGPYYFYFTLNSWAQYLSSLDVALGSDYGLTDMQGFRQAGYFPVHMTGTKGYFAFSDSEAGNGNYTTMPELFYLANKFQDADLGGVRYNFLKTNYQKNANAEDLLYYNPLYSNQNLLLPLDSYFREVETVSFRNGWTPDSIFTAMKAGDNNSPHGHLDIGTFMLDAIGVRWAEELGIDSYSLPGYWENPGRRWTYYRLDAQGQNTLVMNPGLTPGQDPSAFCRITQYSSQQDKGFAIADMTDAYSANASSVKRGLLLFNERSRIILQDEIITHSPTTVWWFMHTKQNITVSGDAKTAILTSGTKRLYARILSPSNASFISMNAAPLPSTPNPAGQNQNTSYRKLAIELADVTETTLSVLFVPLNPEDSIPTDLPEVLPLDDWLSLMITPSYSIDGGLLTARVSIDGFYTGALDATIVAAAYKNNALERIGFSNASEESSNEIMTSLDVSDIDFKGKNQYTLKIMVWDTIENMKPLIEACQFELN